MSSLLKKSWTVVPTDSWTRRNSCHWNDKLATKDSPCFNSSSSVSCVQTYQGDRYWHCCKQLEYLDNPGVASPSCSDVHFCIEIQRQYLNRLNLYPTATCSFCDFYNVRRTAYYVLPQNHEVTSLQIYGKEIITGYTDQLKTKRKSLRLH